jgi:hypothetical protein
VPWDRHTEDGAPLPDLGILDVVGVRELGSILVLGGDPGAIMELQGSLVVLRVAHVVNLLAVQQ